MERLSHSQNCDVDALSMCVLETIFVNKSLFAAKKRIVNILHILLCEQQLEVHVRDLLLQ